MPIPSKKQQIARPEQLTIVDFQNKSEPSTPLLNGGSSVTIVGDL